MRLKLFIFTVLCILFAGCTVPVLPNGKYETSQPGRDDFIAIYNDMLIMRLRNPEKFTGMDDGYWDWGGKFEIRSDNRIIPDMSRSEKRQWFFYYEFYKNGNGIKVNDLRAETGFQFFCAVINHIWHWIARMCTNRNWSWMIRSN